MVWKPDVTVAAIIERDDRFLLVEELIRGHLVLNQPAGHLEDGESLIQAVVRETLEETAWSFAPSALVGIYLWRSQRAHTTLRFAFTGSVSDFDAERALDPPVQATHWLTRADILQRRAQLRTVLVTRCIDDYLAGQRLPLAAIANEVLNQRVPEQRPSP
ncbi:MAG TPA: NUDIX hydrolase [Steroidobacteraceae bacterium]|jgi:8-oxo-dGTP pyrophosphatase MutT (NUDIX family)|nr:NUDIX hydrolase [Steroidobacteraceae bacterium]